MRVRRPSPPFPIQKSANDDEGKIRRRKLRRVAGEKRELVDENGKELKVDSSDPRLIDAEVQR
jgi:tRNA G37 N-methylase Trm5